jgi:hypothetical protein
MLVPAGLLHRRTLVLGKRQFLTMKYIVKKPIQIWSDEEMSAGQVELPAGTVIEETRATQHRRSDALWLRYDGRHIGYALKDDFHDATAEDKPADQKKPVREQPAAVRFLRYTR